MGDFDLYLFLSSQQMYSYVWINYAIALEIM